MGKYDILCHGNEGTVDLAIVGATFSGTITSAAGNGMVSGTVDNDGSLIGTATMGDHVVGFTAAINGREISGSIKVFGWPLPFSGVQIG